MLVIQSVTKDVYSSCQHFSSDQDFSIITGMVAVKITVDIHGPEKTTEF